MCTKDPQNEGPTVPHCCTMVCGRHLLCQGRRRCCVLCSSRYAPVATAAIAWRAPLCLHDRRCRCLVGAVVPPRQPKRSCKHARGGTKKWVAPVPSFWRNRSNLHPHGIFPIGANPTQVNPQPNTTKSGSNPHEPSIQTHAKYQGNHYGQVWA